MRQDGAIPRPAPRWTAVTIETHGRVEFASAASHSGFGSPPSTADPRQGRSLVQVHPQEVGLAEPAGQLKISAETKEATRRKP